MIKNLPLIKIAIGLILIGFGLLFGVLILIDKKFHWAIAYVPDTASFTPIYAGICIASGVFLISKTSNIETK